MPKSTPHRPAALTVAIFALRGFVVALLLAIGVGCQPKPQAAPIDDGTPRVRVRVLAGLPTVTVSAERATAILDGATREPVGVKAGPGFTPVISFDGVAWAVGGKTVKALALRIEPEVDGAVAVNGQAYRGAYTLIPAGPGKLDVVNDVDVESYLQGVLAKELLPDWHPEAYRAQAVIARTYALYETRTNPAGRLWDLNPDERSQVYGGLKAETAKSNAAVQATRGLVAAYGADGQERIFKAYFSSCCGGVSSSAADVFNEPAIPPLAAKSNGTVCSISPRYNWPTVVLSKSELTRRFRAWGAKMNRPEARLPGLRSVDIGSVNAFGRPRMYLVTDTRGQQYALTAEQLRWAINSDPVGGQTVFSGFFKPVDAGDSVRFTDGHGFGHGVGACQWCMQARALSGQSFQQIVAQAFPQSVLIAAF